MIILDKHGIIHIYSWSFGLAKNNPNNETYERIAEWLDVYHSTDDVKEKEKVKALIVTQMIPVVNHIARTIARRAYDPIEDLAQAGFIGLLKAIDKYNKAKNDNFRVYAGYLIIGEMKHYLRDKLNTIRVPRHIQELCIRINNFTKDLTLEEVQALTSDDVAVALQVSTKAVDFAIEVERRRTTLSLEDVYKTEDSGLSYEELISDDENYKLNAEYKDLRIILEGVIDKLPPEEKVLIDLYYKQDMTQLEISKALLLQPWYVSKRMRQTFNLIAEMVANETYEKKQKNIDNEVS